nr:Ankyrin repeat-containing protein [Ipomoea batatas]
MNQMLSTVGAMAAVAKVASTAYYYAEHFGVFNREAKGEAEARSVEVAENQSADVGFLLSRIPVFNGSRYEIWSSMMKTLFVSQDLWDMVDGGYIEEELTVEVLREVRKRDATALLFIQQAIDKSVFSCIAGASKSKEAWDALQKKYQGDAQELNRQNSVDESLLSCPADAIECREAWNVEMESRGYTDEPNQKKAVDELVLSYAADANDPKDAAWDAPEHGCKANTKVVEANIIGKEFGVFNSNCDFKMNHSDNSNPVAESAFHSKLKPSEDGIGKESGDIENNNYGSKKGSRGISNRGGRGGKNCGHFNNNQGGHGSQNGECSNNRGSHGGTVNGDFNNSQGGRGGKGRRHIDNKRGGHRGHSNNNQGDCRGTGSGCSKNQGGRGRGGLDDGCFNSNKGHSGGIDNGHFYNGSEAADYNSKNAKSESASSCTTNATETKEALDAHAIQQGRQANTEVIPLKLHTIVNLKLCLCINPMKLI